MLYRTLLSVLTALVTLASFAQQSNRHPVPIIFDTDMGPDYDDAGAITILHALADLSEAKIMATVASNKYEGVAAVIDVFNTYFNRPDIPIGVPKGKALSLRDSQHWTDSLQANYSHRIKSNKDVPDAVKVYRKVLAQQPEHSVTIVTVGFLTNLAQLLSTQGDEFSQLSGRQLVEKKVKHLVAMAGAFPSGKEFNLEKDAEASKKVLENWPTPIIFCGFEIGAKVKTGLPLVNNKNLSSPAKNVFSISIPTSAGDADGRMSWDEITTLIAVRGHKPLYTLHPGRIKVKADGSNSWMDGTEGHYYLVPKKSPELVANIINQLMMMEPKEEE